jgi:hypothetical protein
MRLSSVSRAVQTVSTVASAMRIVLPAILATGTRTRPALYAAEVSSGPRERSYAAIKLKPLKARGGPDHLTPPMRQQNLSTSSSRTLTT